MVFLPLKSLLMRQTSVPTMNENGIYFRYIIKGKAASRTRTDENLLITNQLRYQLRHCGIKHCYDIFKPLISPYLKEWITKIPTASIGIFSFAKTIPWLLVFLLPSQLLQYFYYLVVLILLLMFDGLVTPSQSNNNIPGTNWYGWLLTRASTPLCAPYIDVCNSTSQPLQ